MGGGLMQLVAYGAQDIYLTGNPQITFFKVVYRRHTNFSMECIRQNFNGKLPRTYDDEGDLSCTISRNGDLIQGVYIKYSLTLEPHKKGVDWQSVDDLFEPLLTDGFGNAMVRQVDLEIGGQLIDRQDGRFMQVYRDLTERNQWGCPYGITKFQKLAGTGSNYNLKTKPGSGDHHQDEYVSNSLQPNCNYYVPLAFWFCRNPGCALPLIALQYHEVKIKLSTHPLSKLFLKHKDHDDYTFLWKKSPEMWVDYIYLDTDERRRFAQVSHEYLIEQVQMKSNSIVWNNRDTEQSYDTDMKGWELRNNEVNVKLNFNHPVKELIWGYALKNNMPFSFPFLSTDFYENVNAGYDAGGPDQNDNFQAGQNKYYKTLFSYILELNGQDRFSEKNANYFTGTQIWKHHTGYGSVYPGTGGTHVYSFALKPEEHQPSGTCNFSRIDSTVLKIKNYQDGTGFLSIPPYDPTNYGLQYNSFQPSLEVYAINYNVLRIMSGMGGLAYSN